MTSPLKSHSAPVSPAAQAEPVPQEDGMPRDIEWADAGRIVASGFAMGSADVVPGVSGGTMAVACGIYERLLDAIGSINARSIRALLELRIREMLWIVHFKFLTSLALGIVLAFVVMVKLVRLPELLQSSPKEVFSVFFGLVFASVFVLGKKIQWNASRVGSLVFGTALGLFVVTRVPTDMPGGPIHMFFYGTISISAMLLPGISGSFILLILGQYVRIIESLKALMELDFSALFVVVPFALGCLVGITAFSRVVAWMLRHYHDPVVAGLCGLLLGSLWRIWPYQHTNFVEVRGKLRPLDSAPFLPESLEIFPVVLFVLGFLAVFLVEFLAGRRTKSGPSS